MEALLARSAGQEAADQATLEAARGIENARRAAAVQRKQPPTGIPRTMSWKLLHALLTAVQPQCNADREPTSVPSLCRARACSSTSGLRSVMNTAVQPKQPPTIISRTMSRRLLHALLTAVHPTAVQL